MFNYKNVNVYENECSCCVEHELPAGNIAACPPARDRARDVRNGFAGHMAL